MGNFMRKCVCKEIYEWEVYEFDEAHYEDEDDAANV